MLGLAFKGLESLVDRLLAGLQVLQELAQVESRLELLDGRSRWVRLISAHIRQNKDPIEPLRAQRKDEVSLAGPAQRHRVLTRNE